MAHCGSPNSTATRSGGFSRKQGDIFPDCEGSSVYVSVEALDGGAVNPVLVPPATPIDTPPDAPVAECTVTIADIPMLPDASGSMNMAGMTTYATSASADEIASFYEAQLAPLDWHPSGPVADMNGMPTRQYTHGGQLLSVSVFSMGGISSVYIVLETVDPSAYSGPCSAVEPVTVQPGAPSSCAVSAANGANQRSGPGTALALVGVLAPGSSAAVTGQATDVDGFVWWRLGEGIWVRSDVVTETGTCESVPVVQP